MGSQGRRRERLPWKCHDNECYFTPIAEVSVRGLGREGVILLRKEFWVILYFSEPEG